MNSIKLINTLLFFVFFPNWVFSQTFIHATWENDKKEEVSAIITYFSSEEITINQTSLAGPVKYQAFAKTSNNEILIQGDKNTLVFSRNEQPYPYEPWYSYTTAGSKKMPEIKDIVQSFWIKKEKRVKSYDLLSDERYAKKGVDIKYLKLGTVHPSILEKYFDEESNEFKILKDPRISSSHGRSSITSSSIVKHSKTGAKISIKNIELPPYNLKNTTVHLVLVANTMDNKLSRAIHNDIGVFNSLIKNAAISLELDYNLHVIKDENFSKNKVSQLINNISIKRNKDIVIFLYRGHGFRWADQNSDYPRMDLTINGAKNKHENSLNIETDIFNPIIKKGPRLLIVLGDLCNSQDGLTPIVNEYTSLSFEQKNSSIIDIERIIKLLSEKGNILAVSAKPGEKSYATNIGGLFTESFIDAFKKYSSPISSKTNSWKNIISESFINARKKSKKLKKAPQNGILKSSNN